STARFQEGDKEGRQLWNCAREGDEEGKPAGWLPSDARNWLPFQARSQQTDIETFCPITHDIDEAKKPAAAAVELGAPS
ncbi:MAG TPA: hypothetical protein VND64_01695, partial [Pirellulales bacterium]|nr:hypothetical protein [Pirellulales bacterium]